MQKSVLFLVAVCGLLVVFAACQSKDKGYKTLDVDDFAASIAHGGAQCVDVRTPSEYTEGHIQGSININVMDSSFSEMADSLLQKGEPVAVYCRSGKRSAKAAEILVQKGYEVLELSHGFNAWKKAGKQVMR